MKYRNPVIPGFYPDPSICRTENKYYLVCSSFQFFPGVPLFESSDLINWKQIGHVLTRNSQLPLAEADSVGGIYAPTIRYHEGRFYMITTNVTHGGNFYVWTDDIYGEWSEPVYIEQDGIDPSLYFENGKAYFMSNGTDDQGVHGVVQCEIDIATGKKLSPAVCIWQGAGGRFLESPHMYKINDYYYLMAAEGGTEYGHMIIYARSKNLFGEFENYAKNPVLTNRNLGGYALQGCGHGDLVQDFSGNWWMVHLAFRQIHQWVMHHITGREVNLVPVTFDENGWFTAGDHGTTRLEMETDRIPDSVIQLPIAEKRFENTKIGIDWCYLKNPRPEYYQIQDDSFKIRSSGVSLDENQKGEAVSFLGIRQQEMQLLIECIVTVPDQEAGITLYMTPDQHYEIAVRKTPQGCEIFKRLHIGDIVQESNHVQIAGDTAKLRIKAEPMCYVFSAEADSQCYELGTAQTKFLSTEIAGNFTGVMIGLYAQGKESQEFAEFRKFLCQVTE
ncbi:MAG: glycoside hydrolase family 43 protein [Oscillospiraceae bacterium]|nr:glycoside hydrolase family 43 protein [Oscillospiraceae bacterium]